MEAPIRCGKHCFIPYSAVAHLLFIILGGTASETFFGMYYTSNIVHHTRHMVLYDTSNIVAAVGGSMGMFLGFSCLQFFRACLDWMIEKFA